MEKPNLIQNNETGLLIPAEEENPQVLADKMYNLIKNESFFRNVQTKQEYYKAEYSWDTVAKRMISVMKQDLDKMQLSRIHSYCFEFNLFCFFI